MFLHGDTAATRLILLSCHALKLNWLYILNHGIFVCTCLNHHDADQAITKDELMNAINALHGMNVVRESHKLHIWRQNLPLAKLFLLWPAGCKYRCKPPVSTRCPMNPNSAPPISICIFYLFIPNNISVFHTVFMFLQPLYHNVSMHCGMVMS